ncbi:ATP-binding cassette domain-containing protein [Methanobrevibacter sp.]|uniref:ATP-binding cassette domain-containing protein n=1 Tax=Methanobrevibacter sp. TaxID=66852 RepID=UPI0025DCEEB5|nr:ATP-binding cassette domain-containing protein [Methanobrevibacter sp.]MBQ2961727.1 ATP-binding cassette domain-containing protein [Methanobrevibacter sp.]
MSQKRKNPKFRKTVDWDSVNNPKTSNRALNSPNVNADKILERRINAKLELMNRYNMTEEEAEITLKRLERKAREERRKENNARNVKRFIEEDNDDVIVPIHVQNRESETLEKPLAKPTFKNKEVVKKEVPIYQNQNQNQNNESSKIEENGNNVKKPKQNVDSLIADLIPENNKDLSIEVKNISLSFEVGNDKIDNLKEYVIRTIKRNKEKRTHFQALKDISFKIYKGEKVGIIGYNGAGKSTLLNVITGIYPPETGEVKTYGRISPLLALGAGFDHNYSGRENIYLNGAILGYDKQFLESKYDEIVEFSELGEFIDFPVKNYSSGMLAKLGFSIATIVEPDILIIDEVLGVGDVNFQKKSSDKIRSLMDKGTTVLLVSHSIPQIRQLCDKAIWIDQGRIVEIGEVNEVCNHYLKDAEKATKDQLKDIRFR